MAIKLSKVKIKEAGCYDGLTLPAGAVAELKTSTASWAKKYGKLEIIGAGEGVAPALLKQAAKLQASPKTKLDEPEKIKL